MGVDAGWVVVMSRRVRGWGGQVGGWVVVTVAVMMIVELVDGG